MLSSYYILLLLLYSFFFFNDTATTEIYTLSLHDALPISFSAPTCRARKRQRTCSSSTPRPPRSEEHTSELQSRGHLVCRLLLEKKKKKKHKDPHIQNINSHITCQTDAE